MNAHQVSVLHALEEARRRDPSRLIPAAIDVIDAQAVEIAHLRRILDLWIALARDVDVPTNSRKHALLARARRATLDAEIERAMREKRDTYAIKNPFAD